MTAHKTHKMKLLVALLAVGAVVLAPVAVGAASDTDDMEITVNGSGVLTVESATNAVTINLTPAPGGVFSSSSDVVTVTTNNSAGYTLTMKDKDSDANLVNLAADTFTPVSGNAASPSVPSAGKWGYAVAGVSNFDATYTAQTNQPYGSSKWAGVPTSGGSAVTLADKSAAAPTGEATTVWYMAAADETQPTGAYKDTVTYTATTK